MQPALDSLKNSGKRKKAAVVRDAVPHRDVPITGSVSGLLTSGTGREGNGAGLQGREGHI